MSRDLYTIVGDGYACNGRKTRAEAIAEASAHFVAKRDAAQRNLDAIADGTIVVAIQRGWHVSTIIEILEK